MERAEFEIVSVAADDRKREYLSTKGVGFGDVVNVLRNKPHYFRQSTPDRERYAVLGPNSQGRFLLIAVVPVENEPGAWRVITAYWLEERRARRMYGED